MSEIKSAEEIQNKVCQKMFGIDWAQLCRLRINYSANDFLKVVDEITLAYHSQFPPKEVTEITDDDLRKLADKWATSLPNEIIGIRSAFAQGYKMRSKLNK